MAFFGGSSKKEEEITEVEEEIIEKETITPSSVVKNKNEGKSINSTTIITAGTEIIGSVNSSNSVQIDGIVRGDIIVNNMVVIGKNGIVEGNIRAQRVMISGELDGTIICDDLEILKSGKVRHEINSSVIILDGEVEGIINADKKIHITTNGIVNADKIMSQNILVDGSIKGDVVATEILEIGVKGYVEGNITVKNIKTQEGGRIIGSMATYTEAIQNSIPEINKSIEDVSEPIKELENIEQETIEDKEIKNEKKSQDEFSFDEDKK